MLLILLIIGFIKECKEKTLLSLVLSSFSDASFALVLVYLAGKITAFSPHQPHALHVTSWYPNLTQENIWDSNTAFNLMPSFILVKWFLLRIPTPLNWITWVEYWHSWCLYLGYFFALTSPLLPSCYCIPGCCKVETECYW